MEKVLINHFAFDILLKFVFFCKNMMHESSDNVEKSVKRH